MFHAGELKRGDEHEIELAEPVRKRRIAFQPVERLRMQVEERLAVADDFGGVALST